MKCPGTSEALQRGRGDRAPPRKSPFASSPGLPPQGHPSLDGPPLGGADSARPRAKPRHDRGMSPTRPLAGPPTLPRDGMPRHCAQRRPFQPWPHHLLMPLLGNFSHGKLRSSFWLVTCTRGIRRCLRLRTSIGTSRKPLSPNSRRNLYPAGRGGPLRRSLPYSSPRALG